MAVKFSVLIPCYNHGKYVVEAVNSTGVFEREDVEVVIVDDGSDQETAEILDSIQHERITLVRQENKGVAAARNTGINHLNGEYVLLLDADNSSSPEYFDTAAQILDAQSSVSVVYSDLYHLHTDGTKELFELPPLSAERLLSGNFIDTCAVVRKSLFDKIGGFDETPELQGYEDWEFWLRAYFNGEGFHGIKKPLFTYRVAESSLRTFAGLPDERRKRVRFLLDKYSGEYKEHVEGVVVHYLEFLMHNENEVKRLSTEATVLTENQLKLELTVDSLREQSDGLNAQLEHALNSVFKLQTRINELEGSKLFKLTKGLRHLKNRLSSNSKAGGTGSFLRTTLFLFTKKGLRILRKFSSKILKHLYIWVEEKPVYIVENAAAASAGGPILDAYNNWLQGHLPTSGQLLEQKMNVLKWEDRPLISIVIPVYNPKAEHLIDAVASVQAQTYTNWELCLADDQSSDAHVAQTIRQLQNEEPRIKVVFREENGHISKASNSALELATGQFCVLMDQDDLLTPDALYQIAKRVQEKPETDLIYSDEDKVDDNGHHSYPHFKPDWSPDNLMSRNYLGHITVIRTSLLKEIGGWRVGFEGSQDYDLMLRVTERTSHVEHIPRVLYHWRIHESSAAAGEDAKPYAYTAAKKALEEAMARRNEPGTVDFLDGFRGYSIRYELKKKDSLVSIIIPTKDKPELIKSCLDSIFSKTSYTHFEVILVDNGSTDKEFFNLVADFRKQYGDKIKHVVADIPFNFSKLINIGAKASSGDYLVLLNNDTEVISEDWLEGMMEQAQRPTIGVVGVKLLYPNNTVQHAGVIIGLGGAAGHVLVGEDRYGPGYFNYVNLLNNYSAVTAACVMVRRGIFESMQGFDEDFQVEYNDVDFCLRVQDAGYNNIYVPHVELYHYESVSRGHPHANSESYQRHLREIKRLRDRWSAVIDRDPCYNPNLSLGVHDFGIQY